MQDQQDKLKKYIQQTAGRLPHYPDQADARYDAWVNHHLPYCDGGFENQPDWWWEDIEYIDTLREYARIKPMVAYYRRKAREMQQRKVKSKKP